MTDTSGDNGKGSEGEKSAGKDTEGVHNPWGVGHEESIVLIMKANVPLDVRHQNIWDC